MIHTIIKWAILALWALGVAMRIAAIGKPRAPLTGGAVAVATVLEVALILWLAVTW